ncbi:ROK family protein [Chloroflexus sp.]|uniref:ROK family protein n=1 Tax=Chloroflexus sp. TaxID=1904827 RepID=UPI00298EFB72|nr:ROK family protein [Chloroflexus sp.]MCS6888878.1 ROK family protein [Chloroflexus sp.]MCX7860455.1 ROK family protein [Chloroflexus sp.]MDW8405089.1 ROK family protein [Chloroflexus sp.]
MKDLPTLISERLTQNLWGVLGNQGYILGIDLGSYGLRVALVDLQHHAYHNAAIESLDHEDPETAVMRVIELARNLMAREGVTVDRLVRVGVGFSGPVDLRHGTVRLAPRRPGWENYPLQERFEQAFDAVTLIDNDANLIALGEATFGVGKGCQHLFYFHLSTGVGGGAVLNGRLYHGAHSMAGEIGHAVVGHGWNGDGRPETLEELVSISGLLRRANAEGMAAERLEDIFSDHPVARRVVQHTVDLMATRIAQVIALLDPEMVVLGGIVVRIGGDSFVEAIAAKVNDFIAPQFARPVQVVPSVLGPDSVAIGAVAMALDSLSD